MEPSEIEDLARSPKSLRGEEGAVEERSVDEVIKADRYVKASSSAVDSVPFGLRIARTVPGGTV
jgi:hypothetical protein